MRYTEMTRPKASAFADKRTYGIVHGSRERQEHARALAHGCDLLGPDFACSPCPMCNGVCVSKYSEGFGCDYCSGTGLVQGGGAAPAFDSQRHQVLVAASHSMLLDFEVCVC